MLKLPGLYEVGGLGACTLISRYAMLAGVNFEPIKNLSFWGEDRHFCVRAAAIGIPLYVDTYVPAYHIYRESDLDGAERFNQMSRVEITTLETEFIPHCTDKETGLLATEAQDTKLTLTMVVKNEGNRYLKRVLMEHRKYIDEAVIIDDGSTDHTVSICLEALQGIPIRLIKIKPRNLITKLICESSNGRRHYKPILIGF